MKRILVKGEWYEEIGSTSFYESEYEKQIEQMSEALFPRHLFVKFRELVESPYGASKPDYILIDDRYQNWSVVEVEMAHHSLEGHVIPQVTNFHFGTYGDKHVSHILERKSDLDPERLSDLISRNVPGIFIIVNREVPSWERALKLYSVNILVVEMYCSMTNNFVYLANNRYTSVQDEPFISTCRLDPLLPRHIVVDRPQTLPINSGERVTLLLESGRLECIRLDVRNRTWLRAMRPPPLRAGIEYRIHSSDDGALSVSRVRKR